MKKSMKKLMLNRETVRALQDTELQAVVGGRAAQAGAPVENVGPWQKQANARIVPCPSSITNGEGGFDLHAKLQALPTGP